jgi:hypothetical protein
MAPPRFFLAHAKADSDETLEVRLAQAKAVLEPLSKGKPFEIVLGRDYFAERFKACGSWESWAQEVATGRHYLARDPLFAGILIPAGPVGAGTAKIVEAALANRRPCFAFNGSGGWAKVLGVRLETPGDWQSGWRLQVDRTI